MWLKINGVARAYQTSIITLVDRDEAVGKNHGRLSKHDSKNKLAALSNRDLVFQRLDPATNPIENAAG